MEMWTVPPGLWTSYGRADPPTACPQPLKAGHGPHSHSPDNKNLFFFFRNGKSEQPSHSPFSDVFKSAFPVSSERAPFADAL